MIAIAAPTYDPAGHLILRVRPSNAYQSRRRGSVTATLDGGAVVYDGGHSVSDNIVSASYDGATREQVVSLTYLVAYYPELIVSIETGCYMARLDFGTRQRTLILSLRLLRRLDT